MRDLTNSRLLRQTPIVESSQQHGLEENRIAARSGGELAGNAKMDLEQRTRKRITTKQNYLHRSQKQIKELGT